MEENQWRDISPYFIWRRLPRILRRTPRWRSILPLWSNVVITALCGHLWPESKDLIFGWLPLKGTIHCQRPLKEMAFDVAEMLKKTSAKCIGATDWRIGGGYESLRLPLFHLLWYKREALGPIRNRKTVEKNYPKPKNRKKFDQNRKPHVKMTKSITFHIPVIKTLIDPIRWWQVEHTE